MQLVLLFKRVTKKDNQTMYCVTLNLCESKEVTIICDFIPVLKRLTDAIKRVLLTILDTE